MHQLALKFLDVNTIEQQWTQFKDGKSAVINVFKQARVK